MDRFKLFLMGTGAAALLLLAFIGAYTVLYVAVGPQSNASWKPSFKQGECLFTVIQGEQIPFKVNFVNMKKQTYLVEVLESQHSEENTVLSIEHDYLENGDSQVYRINCPDMSDDEDLYKEQEEKETFI